jgi:hypothetical protein
MATANLRTDGMASRFGQAIMPVKARWNSLDIRMQRVLGIGGSVLLAGLILAFVWLPNMRARETLAARLPQLEAQLALMQSQAKEVAALAKQPAAPAPARIGVDVAALQSIFGPDAQITSAQNGFRIVIPAIAYSNWWDKTTEAISRHELDLKEATVSLLPKRDTGAAQVNVDMRLGADPRTAGSTSVPARK